MRRSATTRKSGILWCGVLLLLFNTAPLRAELELQVVTANPGKIMAGEKVLAQVPAGTRLWIFNKKSGWAEVKVPGGEDHGWMKADSLQPEEFTDEQKKLLGTASPLFSRYAELAQAGNYPAALAALEEAAKLERQALGDDHPNLGVTLLYLARARYSVDDVAGSERAYDECLAVRTKHLGKVHYDVAEVLNDLSAIYKDRGDTTRALEFNQQALELLTKAPESTANDVAATWSNRGTFQHTAGDFAGARKSYLEALQQYRRIPGNQELNIASTLHNYGVLLVDIADYPAARAAFDESLALRRKRLGNEHDKVAQSLGEQATLFYKQGKLAEARKNMEQVLAIYRKQPGSSQLSLASALNNMANMLSAQKDHAGARKCLEEALAIVLKLLGPEHPDLGHIYHNLGNTLKDLKDQAGARRNYDLALAIRFKSPGPDHPFTADVQQSLANLQVDQENFAEALQNYQRSLDINQKFYGPDHPRVAGAHEGLGWVMLGLKKNDEAAVHWDQARRLARRHTQNVLPSLSASEQLDFLAHTYQESWFDALSFGWKLRRDPAIVGLSFNWLINGKAIAQESLAAQQLLLRDATNPQFAALVKELTAVRQQLATQALSTPAANQAAAHQKQVAELTAREQQLAGALRQATGETKNNTAWVELKDLAAALPPGSLYVDLVRMSLEDFQDLDEAPVHYLAWLVPAGEPTKAVILDLGEAAPIEKAVAQARSALAKSAAADGALRQQGEVAATTQANQALQEVADLVLKPLLPQLAKHQQLVLSPDGSLWLVPWAALPAGENKCLLERVSLRYVLSGRDLVSSAVTKLGTNAPAIFANPDFDLRGPAAKTAIKTILPRATFTETTRGIVSQSSLPRVTPLPFTALEAAAAQPLLAKLGGNKPLAYEQNSALEEVAKTLQRPRQLFFATHGFFLPDQGSAAETPDGSRGAGEASASSGENPLVRCGLLLAGCNQPRTPGLDDGILTGLEIVGMDLRGTELVVLSACETGIGKVRNGEGVAGLRQAFQLAGAQSVVSTLWQVPDRDSALIMQDFFTNLAAGQSKADALRNAQLKRIAARKEKSGAAHPFFWAAWTVTGE